MSAQHPFLGQSPQSPVRSNRGPKILKACEECRRRKQRCDGQVPCSICSRRGYPCSYRASFRNRTARIPKTRSGGPTPPPRAPTAAQVPDEPHHTHSLPPRVQIFNNIRATRSAGGTELFYGASSVFSLLQHCDVHLPSHAMPAAPSQETNTDEEVQDGGESIQRYNYQTVAFDNVPPPMPRAAHCIFVSQDLAQAALRNFLLSAHHAVPFVDPDTLCATLEQLYDARASPALEPAQRAMVVVAMAIGATPTTDNPCREHLLAQARAETEGLLYDISLRAVQVALLMGQCEFDAGNPNMSYLQLGSAIRKAFAAGVHRRASSLEARQTMWALYCAESVICLMFGRQPTLAEDASITAPLAVREAPCYLRSYVQLCTLVRSASSLYCHKSAAPSLAADLGLAKSVGQQLRDFSSTIKTELGLHIGGQLYALTGDKLSWHVTISYLYHFTTLLVYRPFFLLDVELQRRRGLDGGRRNVGYYADSAELAEARQGCLQAARSLVLLSDSLLSVQIGVEGFYHHAFFLESACFVLVLAAVYDDDSASDNANSLGLAETGLKLLRQLGRQREPIRSVLAALEQMLARATALIGGGHHQERAAAAEGLLSPGAAAPSFLLHEGSTAPLEAADSHVLDELWAMTDWDLDFPFLDVVQSEVPK